MGLPGQKPIVVVGSINTDLVSVSERIPVVGETVLGSDFQIHAGGKGANQAVAVARLGYPVRMIGRLGSDSFGREARVHLEQVGVDTELVGTSDGPSGVAMICVSTRGENSIVVVPGANASLAPMDLDVHRSAIRNAAVVLAQLEIPIATVAHLAHLCANEGVPLILDPAPAAELPESVFRDVAWFTPNQTEAAYYTKGKAGRGNPSAVVEELHRKGVRDVVLKLGAEGAAVTSDEGELRLVPAFQVDAIDTTAAGDAFNGGFAVGLLQGMSPSESARLASAVAAISVTRRGAQPSMPNAEEVRHFLAKHPERML
jgi:ribokinase